MKIMIADDDKDLASGMVELLSLSNKEVIGIAQDGTETIQMCKEHHPDFLLLDLTMPGMDGFSVLKELQNLDWLKIIVITGMVDKKTMEELKQFSIHAILRKPLDFQALSVLLENND